jgi:hypothetical protein
VHELASAGLGVETLAVTCLGDLERDIDMDLEELALTDQTTGQLALGPERRDERRQHDDARHRP